MRRFLLVLLPLLLIVPAQAAPGATRVHPALTGTVGGFRLSGVEPDGDPLYQVALDTTLGPSAGIPRLHLIVSSYMENFKPDTTPILPDLLHPKETAQNLGGFLQGKALVTDDSGAALYHALFTAEAFLDNSNHVVLTLQGVNAARGGSGTLRGSFLLQNGGTLRGTLTGSITLPAAARAQIARHHGASMPQLKALIDSMSVTPHPMVGTSSGTASSAPPLKTGFGQQPASPSQRHISPLTIASGAAAVLFFLLAGILWWRQRQVPDDSTQSA